MKKSLLVLSTFLLIVTSVNVALAVDFPDVPSSHPNYTAVNFLRDRGVINGYEDGTYKPSRSVTRAEFLKIILLSSGNPAVAGDLVRPAFPDVPMTAWYFGLVNRGLALGVISGYPDGTFQPDRTVSRVEALKIMLRANNITEAVLPTSGANFSDIPEGQWYTPYARYAMLARLFDGAQLRPNEMMNRGQVAEIVYRFYQHRPDLLPAASSTPSPTATPSPSSTPAPTTPAPTVTASTGFRVASASVLAPSPASYSGACPAWSPISFVGIVNTNGQAGNIAYRWEKIGGSHVTNFEVIGIPAGQSSVALHWNPNWDVSVHSAYRLHVLNNADGTNFADSTYVDFAVDCTSAGTSPTPSVTPAGEFAITSNAFNFNRYGDMYAITEYRSPCPSTLFVGLKGGIRSNGVPGTIRYHTEDTSGHIGPDYFFTFTTTTTTTGSIHVQHQAPNPNMDWGSRVWVVVHAPTGTVSRSNSTDFQVYCAPASAVHYHEATSASFTAHQPGVVAGGYVCGRDNTYNMAGRIYMRQPALGGSISYRWLFSTGAESPTYTMTHTPGGSEYMLVPNYPWTISRTAPAGTYLAWLSVTGPNTVTSPSVSITKPTCVSL